MKNSEGKEILNILLNDTLLNRDIIANEILNKNKHSDHEIINKINDKLYDEKSNVRIIRKYCKIL